MTAMIHRLRGKRPEPQPIHIAMIRRRTSVHAPGERVLIPGWWWSCTCGDHGEDANWRHPDALADFTSHAQAFRA